MLGNGDEIIELAEGEWYQFLLMPLYKHHLFLMMAGFWQECSRAAVGLSTARINRDDVMMQNVTAEQRADYQREGALVLRGVFTDWLEALRAGCARNMAAPGSYGTENVRPGEGGGRFFRDSCHWQPTCAFCDF